MVLVKMATNKCMKCVFYSYKGGGGRTTTLVNVAHRLRKIGKSVLVIDFDFDAPGADLFGKFKQRLFEMEVDAEYINHFKNEKIPDDMRRKFKDTRCNLSDTTAITSVPVWRVDPNETLWKIEDKRNDERFYVTVKPSTLGKSGKNIRLIVECDHKGILEYLSDNLPPNKIDTNPSMRLDNYIYEVEKEDVFDGSLYIMRVGRGEDLGRIKTMIENRRNYIMDNNLLRNMIERINDNYMLDYILIDSRPGREYTIVFETIGLGLGESDLFIVCTNYNKSIIEVTFEAVERIGKMLKDNNITIPVHHVLVQRPKILKDENYNETIDFIEKRVPTWELPTMPKDATEGINIAYIELNQAMLFDYSIIEDSDPVHCRAYKNLAMRIVSFNSDDIINKVEHAKKDI